MKNGSGKSLRANALIEFALVLPLLCLILFGIIDFSLMFYDKNILINASREGARYGIIAQNNTYPSSTAIADYVNSNFTTGLISFSSTSPSANVTATPSATPPATGDTLSVTVEYPYTCLIINRLTSIPSPVILTSTTVMVYE